MAKQTVPDQQEQERQAFGERFRRLVQGRSWGWKTALAAELGVGPEMIKRYEKGEDMPSMPRAAILARDLGVSIHYLLTGQGPEDPWGDLDLFEFLLDTTVGILGEKGMELSGHDLAKVVRNMYALYVREKHEQHIIPTKERIRTYMESHDVLS